MGYEKEKGSLPEDLTESDLDGLLYLTLENLKSTPKEIRSVVIVGIYEPSTGRFFAAPSVMVDNSIKYGIWNHAEYEAISIAREAGVDLSQCVATASLSPCFVESGSRAHQSCTQLYLDAGIKRIHVGRLDERQASLEQYAELGLEVTVTKNETLLSVCKKLDDYFNPENLQSGIAKADFIEQALGDL